MVQSTISMVLPQQDRVIHRGARILPGFGTHGYGVVTRHVGGGGTWRELQNMNEDNLVIVYCDDQKSTNNTYLYF